MSDRRNNPWQRERKLHGTIHDAIFGNIDNDFEMNDYKKRSIYLNNLGEENSTEYTHTGYKHDILYHHNKLHYRCDNFKKKCRHIVFWMLNDIWVRRSARVYFPTYCS